MGKTLDLISNSYVMFLDYRLQILSRLFPGKDHYFLSKSYRNPLRPKIQRALGNDLP